MSIKIAFFDIDHTLYDHKHQKFEETGISSIKKLYDKGIKVVVCTARPYHSLKELGCFDQFDFVDYITSNGAVVFANKKVIFKQTILPTDSKKLISLVKSLNLTMECVSIYDRYLIAPKDDYVDKLYSIYKEVIVPVKEFNNEELTGFLLFAPKEYDEKIKPYTDLSYFRFADYGVDIMGTPHIKGEGVSILLNYYNMDKNDAIAFGDDIGDISMFEQVGISVAMGNGKKEVKQKATYTTYRIEHHGIRHALKHFKLL